MIYMKAGPYPGVGLMKNSGTIFDSRKFIKLSQGINFIYGVYIYITK